MWSQRFFDAEPEASSAFEEMKEALSTILSAIPNADDPEVDAKAHRVILEISSFVEKYS